MTSRAGFVSGVLLAVAFSLSLAVEGAEKGLKNNSGDAWVAMRHKDDWNKNEDIALVLFVKKKPGQPNDNVVTATVWLYDDLNAAGDKYKFRKKYENLTGVLKHNGGPKRGRETCVLTLPGTNGIKIWATLYRNKVNSSSGASPRVHHRVSLRYKEGNIAVAASTDKSKGSGGCEQAQLADVGADDGCEEEPNEDVLEEEAIVEDPMTNLPVLPYDP